MSGAPCVVLFGVHFLSSGLPYSHVPLSSLACLSLLLFYLTYYLFITTHLLSCFSSSALLFVHHLPHFSVTFSLCIYCLIYILLSFLPLMFSFVLPLLLPYSYFLLLSLLLLVIAVSSFSNFLFLIFLLFLLYFTFLFTFLHSSEVIGFYSNIFISFTSHPLFLYEVA